MKAKISKVLSLSCANKRERDICIICTRVVRLVSGPTLGVLKVGFWTIYRFSCFHEHGGLSFFHFF